MSVDPKSITDLRSGTEKRRSSREIQRSTFARFLGLFDFRLLQQYLPQADIGAVSERSTAQGRSVLLNELGNASAALHENH
jgi:hypothetical protein